VQSVVETPAFLRDAKVAGMERDERDALVSFLAMQPDAGEIVVGTGGARKLRWRRPGAGKSGGYRVITFFAGPDVPVFLLNVYTKGDRDNLSQAERNIMRDSLGAMVARFRKGSRR
jgi:hypothetical protein